MLMDYYDRIEPTVFKRIADIIGNPRRILDIGCGDCRLSNFIARATGCSVVAIDTDTQGFRRAREQSERLETAHLVTCIRHDAEDLASLCPPLFDCCVSLYVLHELEHPLRVLTQAHAVLYQGGRLLLIDFPRGSIAERLYDESYYTTGMMKSMVRRAGFSSVSVEYFGEEHLALVNAT